MSNKVTIEGREEKKSNKVWETEIAGFEISLGQQSKHHFSVIYGKQYTQRLSYADACKEIGQCILHALTLEGKIDTAE